MTQSFSIRARLASFRHACRGVVFLLVEQHNARVHLAITLVVLAAGSYFSLLRWEWSILLLAIGGVWMAEALNTAVEYVADACHPEYHPLIKRAKDVAAAAVLFFAVMAVSVGVIVFAPYILPLFDSAR